MPDVWTHYFFAKQVMMEQRLPIKHRDIYYLGAQGPDILFYQAFEPMKKDKPGTPLAQMFHQVKTESLLRFVFGRRQTADDILADYLSGFLTHYALDSTVHPMIHRLTADGRDHKGFEMALDMKFYQMRRHGQSITQASVSHEIAAKRVLPESIAQFYVELADEVFSQPVDPALIRESYRDFRRFHNLTNLSGIVKKPIVEQLLKRFAPDYGCYFYGEYVARLPIEQEVWEEYLDRFFEATQVFSRLNRHEMPAKVVNFSGYSLEMSPEE